MIKYDKAGNELAKFRDIPYAYTAAFMPGKNIIAVKSTEGRLGFYDLPLSAKTDHDHQDWRTG